MDSQTTQNILLIIGALTTAICSIIAAIKSNKASFHSAEANHKIDETKDKIEVNSQDYRISFEQIKEKAAEIAQNTDGNLTELRTKMRASNEINNHLIELITCLVDMLPEGSLTKAKKELEKLKAQAGYRRVTDITAGFTQSNLEQVIREEIEEEKDAGHEN